MSEFQVFAFKSDDRSVFFIKKKKKLEDLNYSSLFFLRQTVSLRLTCLGLLGARLGHHGFWLIFSSNF